MPARVSQSAQHALDATARLNDAYRTLRDPMGRAMYLLKLEGFDVGEQGGKDVPPELLEEVFELNMALEEIRDGSRPEALEAAPPEVPRDAERDRSPNCRRSSAEWDGGARNAWPSALC